ncbi:MAG: C39 family peptidase [Caryophanon sp.]|nr:C39 family peptidase [Caryophanon sp.]
MFKRSIFLLIVCAILSGCSERSLEILTVEFNSGAIVPNVTVALIDAKTEEVIATKKSDDEGTVVFTDLKPRREYIVSNVSLAESVIVDSTVFTYEKDMAYFLFETHFPHNTQGLAVPMIEQPDGMQSGEALVALTAVLHYYGIEATVDEVYATFMKQPFTYDEQTRIGGHPNTVFVGDAYARESYVLAKPVAEAAVALSAAHNVPLSVYNASNSTKEQLLQIVDSGVPIIAWVTKQLAPPEKTVWQLADTNEPFSMTRNVEPVVIIGQAANKLHVISAATRKTYDVNAFYDMFTQVGAQAVVIRK